MAVDTENEDGDSEGSWVPSGHADGLSENEKDTAWGFDLRGGDGQEELIYSLFLPDISLFRPFISILILISDITYDSNYLNRYIIFN